MKKDIDKIICKIAKQEHISKEIVIKEIQETIDAGYYSTDPAVQMEWTKTPFNNKPTVQEFILYIADKIK